jgi:hypothetical protein
MAKATECKTMRETPAMRRFVMGNEYKGKILDIRNRIAADIREFTVRNVPTIILLACSIFVFLLVPWQYFYRKIGHRLGVERY